MNNEHFFPCDLPGMNIYAQDEDLTRLPLGNTHAHVERGVASMPVETTLRGSLYSADGAGQRARLRLRSCGVRQLDGPTDGMDLAAGLHTE